MSEGTRAHQLAMYAVYEMPLAMVSDYPEAYEGQPEFEFIEKVPSAWDDTKVLGGEPGKFITITRRNGDNWYLGSMTNWDARDVNIPLDFLATARTRPRSSPTVPDADRVATSVVISKKTVTSRRSTGSAPCAGRWSGGDFHASRVEDHLKGRPTLVALFCDRVGVLQTLPFPGPRRDSRPRLSRSSKARRRDWNGAWASEPRPNSLPNVHQP